MTTDVTDTDVGTIRAGFLGAGFMARVHAHAARAAGADLRSIVASSPDSSAAAARALRVETSDADDTGLPAASDVVHVCTPNALHARQASAAIAAGLHVICEKPLATTVEDARALVAAADTAGIVTGVPFVYRYHPVVREARARIAAGDLGTLLTVQGAYLQDWMLASDDANWRAEADGGPSRAFADIGSHLCDAVEFITGDRIARVSARTRTVFAERGGRPVQNEDIAAVIAETTTGALVTLLVSQMAPGRRNGLVIEVHGTAQSMRFAQENPEQLWIGARSGSQLLLRDPALDHPDSARLQRVPAGHPMGYQDAFNAFVDDVYATIRGEVRDGVPTFADGLRAAVLTAAVLASAASGRWTEVDA